MIPNTCLNRIVYGNRGTESKKKADDLYPASLAGSLIIPLVCAWSFLAIDYCQYLGKIFPY
jgi:hypothetical protein